MSPREALRKRNKARGIKGKDELASEEDLMMHVPFSVAQEGKDIISNTCLSISDISDKTVKELKQEIEKIKSDDRLTNRAKAILINEAEEGIEKFKSIKKKVKDFCLSE